MTKKSNFTMTVADVAFSQCVKERANYCCERCGKSYRDDDSGLDCSHVFSRRYKSIRYDPDNAMALCFHCHKFWWHSDPVDSGEWAIKKLGRDKIKALRKKREINIEYDINKVAAYYNLTLSSMKKIREQEPIKRIEFESFIRFATAK